MKAKTRQVRERESQVVGDEQVRAEIQSFLKALDSYPEHFALNPGITFEQHRDSVVPTAKTVTFRRTSYRLAGGTIPFIRR